MLGSFSQYPGDAEQKNHLWDTGVASQVSPSWSSHLLIGCMCISDMLKSVLAPSKV